MNPEQIPGNVLRTIRDWKMLPDEIRVGVAVSGGADSVALFRILLALSIQTRWMLSVLHVNHGLRAAESDADEDFVRSLARQHGVAFESARLDPIGACNLEQEARILRYRWFTQCAQLRNLHRIATGHTRSDQAETVLFRFLRGSGGAGLAGIRPVLDSGVVRPLIAQTREELRAYLDRSGQRWREDSSNGDLNLDRNRIRSQLLPQIAREWNPSIETNLAQTAGWAQAEEEYWEAVVAALAQEHFSTRADGSLVFRTGALRALPVAAVRRLIREAIRRASGSLLAIDFSHVESIRRMFEEREGSGRLQIPGLDVMRSFDWVRFALPGSYAGDRHVSIPAPFPGEIQLPSGICLMLQVQNADYRYNENVNCFSADRILSPLVLRSWQPGDRYRPIGRDSAIKVKLLFQEARIPLWERRTWPVLAMSSGQPATETIVWTRQFGTALEFAVDRQTERTILIGERANEVPVGEREKDLNAASAKLESEPDGRRL